MAFYLFPTILNFPYKNAFSSLIFYSQISQKTLSEIEIVVSALINDLSTYTADIGGVFKLTLKYATIGPSSSKEILKLKIALILAICDVNSGDEFSQLLIMENIFLHSIS